MLVQLLDHQLALLLHKKIFYMLFWSNIVKYKLVGQNRDEFLIWESAGSPPSYLVPNRPIGIRFKNPQNRQNQVGIDFIPIFRIGLSLP